MLQPNTSEQTGDKQTLRFGLLAIAVFVTRLPFLFNGYGVEEDAWGLVVNAREIAESGRYVYSRLPGHPVQELVLATMPDGSPFLYNVFSALFATLASVFFARILKLYSFPFPLAGGLALAFTPVFFISGTYTIDYCWALAFIMMSHYFLLKGKYLLAGVLLGISVGCRLTSALMFLPLLIMLFELSKPLRWRAVFRFAISTAVAGTLVYLPAITEYGLGVFSTYALPYPSFAKVVYKGTLGVWGVTGFIAIVFALGFIVKNFRKKDNPLISNSPGRLHEISWIVAVALTFLIYIRLPEKSAFLIPALPFIILLIMHRIKSRMAWRIFFILTIASPFILGVNLSDAYRGSDFSTLAKRFTVSGQEIFVDPLTGPVLTDHYKRSNKKAFTLEVIRRMKDVNSPSLLLAGWWYNEIAVRMRAEDMAPWVEVRAHAGEEELKQLADQGVEIFYLPEIDLINDRRYGHPFTAALGKPFMQATD